MQHSLRSRQQLVDTLVGRRLVSATALCAAMTLPSLAQADVLADGLVSDQLEMDDEFIVGVAQPTAIAFLPDGRILVAERLGDLVVRTADGTMTTAGSFPVNSVEGEQGLLNVLPHPDFATNHLLYFFYSASDEAGGTPEARHRVVTIELGDDNLLDMSTETLIVGDLMGPENHNASGMSIYGDYLFIGTGDTGSNSFSTPGNDIGNYYGTCLTNANGKLLRVHLDGSIPEDNPLIGQTVTACGAAPGIEPTETSNSPREEIFAWGFRNPFRLWADPKTGNVWVGGVGESTFEMIQLVPPSGGLHFGWPYREGNAGLPIDTCQNILPNVGDCTPPVYVCEQSDNGGGYSTPAPDDPNVPNECDSITGGLILDGCEWPADFEGRYVFGDYQNERVWTLPLNETRDGVIGEREELLRTQSSGPVAFAEYGGALYMVGHSGNGHITRLAPKEPEPACDVPAMEPEPEPVDPTPTDPVAEEPAPEEPVTEEMPPEDPAPDAEPATTEPAPSEPAPAEPASTDTPAPANSGETTPGAAEPNEGQTSVPTSDPATPMPGQTTGGAVSPTAPSEETPTLDSTSDSTSDGCGCRVTGRGGATGWAWLVLGVLGVGLVRRRW